MLDKSKSWVSPHYLGSQIDLANATTDDRITLLEDRIRGYITTPSRLLSNIYENSIILVMLGVISCLELIEVLNQGKSSHNKSRKFFKAGFRRVFQTEPPTSLTKKQFETQLDNILDDIYIQVRCGLMHFGTSRSKVVLSKELQAPFLARYDQKGDQVEMLVLNPSRCILALDVYLSEYCQELRNTANVELRAKFDQGWEVLRSESFGAPPHAGSNGP